VRRQGKVGQHGAPQEPGTEQLGVEVAMATAAQRGVMAARVSNRKGENLHSYHTVEFE